MVHVFKATRFICFTYMSQALWLRLVSNHTQNWHSLLDHRRNVRQSAVNLRMLNTHQIQNLRA